MTALYHEITSNYMYVIFCYIDFYLMKCNHYINHIHNYARMALDCYIVSLNITARIRKFKSMGQNKLKKYRESMLISKAELARQAKISPITINRIEKNMPCRLETQRKILLALGLKPADKKKIF